MDYKRSRAREVVLQLLFQLDVNKDVPLPAIRAFVSERLRRDPTLETFCMTLYQGISDNLKSIDQLIRKASENWRLERMTGTDRNVLRMGTYEMAFAADRTPGPVALNEAIELARRYGTKDSAAFVNGVLDKIFQSLNLTKTQPKK